MSQSSFPTPQDQADYDAFRAAEDEDCRFEIIEIQEPDFIDGQFLLRRIDIATGAIVESHTCRDPYSDIEAYRLSQGESFEQRYAPFGPAWEREQEERKACAA